MERVSIIRDEKPAVTIPAVRNTIRNVPVIANRRPAAGKCITPSPLIMGRRIIGCLVSRMTKTSAPLLFLLVTGEIVEEGHRPQTRGMYYHDLVTQEKGCFLFGVIIENKVYTAEYEKLTVTGFEFRGERGKALYMKIVVKGKSEVIEEGAGQTGVLENERFFFFVGNEIAINGAVVDDAAGFSIEGVLDDEGMKKHAFHLRRKEREKIDFRDMRGEVSADMTFRNPEEYEDGYEATFTLTLERLVYEGEENYPDEDGIWGREFRYRMYGKMKVRVYTTEREI